MKRKMSIEERLLRRLIRKVDDLDAKVNEMKGAIGDIEKKNGYWGDWMQSTSPDVVYGQSAYTPASLCQHVWGVKVYDAYGNAFQSCIRCGTNQTI